LSCLSMKVSLESKNALRAKEAQLADRKLVASQHRSRAKIARSAIFFIASSDENAI